MEYEKIKKVFDLKTELNELENYLSFDEQGASVSIRVSNNGVSRFISKLSENLDTYVRNAIQQRINDIIIELEEL